MTKIIANKKENNYLYPMYFLTIVVLFMPQFQSYIGLVLEQALSVFLIGTCFYYLIAIYKPKLVLAHVMVVIAYMVLILISLLRGVNITGFVLRDFFELSKPVYLGLTFLLSYSVLWDDYKVKKYFKFLMLCLGLLSLFGIFESTTALGNTIGSILYKDLRGGVQYKAVGSFISPYVFASVLMVPFFYYLSLLFSKASISRMGLMILFFLTIMLTQSRTVILSLGISLCIILFYNLVSKSYSGRKKINAFIMVIMVLFTVSLPIIIDFVELNFTYIYSGLNVVFSNISDFEQLIYSTPSISNRYEQMIFVLENIDPIPIVGANIGKELVNPESFYALYLYRVGLLGVFIHFALLFFVFKKSRFLANKYKDDFVLNAIFISIVFYTISVPFSYASSALNDQVRSGFIFYTLAGMVFKLYLLEKKNENIDRNTNLR